jgi:hypothetical protein
MERRFVAKGVAPVKIETRTDGGKKIVGYGAVFYDPANASGTEYQLGERMQERISPAAFDRAIAENHDARGLYNHDPSHLLGRTASGTMRLSRDAKGLRYEIDLPDTQTGRDVAISIERGDLTGSSFAFVATRTTWSEEQRGDAGIMIRSIDDLDLYDTGPVTYPAYEATSTGLRSAETETLQQEVAAWQRKRSSESDAVAIRSRLIQIGLDD